VLSIIALWRAVRLRLSSMGMVAFVFELNLLALEPTVRWPMRRGWGFELPKNPPSAKPGSQCDATHGSIVTCPYNYAGRSILPYPLA
jgi:hypothetical protein